MFIINLDFVFWFNFVIKMLIVVFIKYINFKKKYKWELLKNVENFFLKICSDGVRVLLVIDKN